MQEIQINYRLARGMGNWSFLLCYITGEMKS